MDLASDSMDKLIEHIETYLGPISEGWSRLPKSDERLPFQVIHTKCSNSDNSCISTLGLSKEGLSDFKENKKYFQELFVCSNSTTPRNLPAVLISLGLELLSTKKALLRGEVIGPRKGAVISGTTFSALYVASPVYWPDNFGSLICGDTTVIFCWLVPIFPQEANFIKKNGWSKFEDQLIETDPNMCDLNRPSVIP
jgi:hypothetical protein